MRRVCIWIAAAALTVATALVLLAALAVGIASVVPAGVALLFLTFARGLANGPLGTRPGRRIAR